jgi:hypothetical protein
MYEIYYKFCTAVDKSENFLLSYSIRKHFDFVNPLIVSECMS